MLPLKKILATTDFSEAALDGLKVANELAAHFSAELVAIHVIPPLPITTVPGVAAPVAPAGFNIPSYQQELEASARKSLEETVNNIFSNDLRIKQVVAHGPAASEIVQVADSEAVDVIVISSHGQTGWRRIMFGSVAEKVVQLSNRPVLAIPVERKKEKE